MGDEATQESVLGRPVSPAFRVVSVLLATGLFFLSLAFWFRSDGDGVGDVAESNVPIFAIEHGTLQCAYPAGHGTAVPPLYPLVAAGVMAVTGFFPPGFDPLSLVQHAHPWLAQMILVPPALALAALPLYRMCRTAPELRRNDDLRLAGDVAETPLMSHYRRWVG